MITNANDLAKPIAEYQKFFPATFSLETPRVILRLLSRDDFPELAAIAKEKSIWKYFTKELSDDAELQDWIEELLSERAQQKRMPFTIIDRDTKRVCGSTSYLNISFYDRRLEIGSTWLGTESMGTGVNRHAKFALLSYAFEAMKMERVEVKTDNLNEQSKNALRKIGMTPEGILRSHMQMHSDRRRDSIYYSILKSEWEDVKLRFFGELL